MGQLQTKAVIDFYKQTSLRYDTKGRLLKEIYSKAHTSQEAPGIAGLLSETRRKGLAILLGLSFFPTFLYVACLQNEVLITTLFSFN